MTTDQHSRLQAELAGFTAEAIKHQCSLDNVVASRRPMGQGMAVALTQISRVRREVQVSWGLSQDEISRGLQEFHGRTQKAARVLAANGWYLDPGWALAEIQAFSALFESAEGNQAEAALVAHFGCRLPDIERALFHRFPKRAVILGQAFNAHRAGHYAVSTPVFLSQADGICQELRGEQVYRRREGKPRLAKHLNTDDGSLRASLLCTLAEANPISEATSPRSVPARGLNRHAILHGEDSEYATETNSARALSHLAYVSWVLD